MLVKKSEFYDLLESIKEFSAPKSELEQYPTDSVTAADLLFSIQTEMGDSLSDRIVLDLGAGTGRLSLGSLILGASHVFSVETDSDALNILKQNACALNYEEAITTIQKNIEDSDASDHIRSIILETLRWPAYNKSEILCIMNPPFGFVKKGIDIRFLEIAISLSGIVYSIHAAGEKNRTFIRSKVEKFGGRITHIMSQKLILRAQFHYHKQKRMPTLVDIYRIECL
jgi:predicted RNA methylase